LTGGRESERKEGNVSIFGNHNVERRAK